MKLVTFLLLTLSAISAQSSIVLDGNLAFCKNKIDVIKSLRSNVYQIHKPTLTVNGEIVTVKVKLRFLRCVEENANFKFIEIEDHMKASYQFPMFNNGEITNYVTVYREDKMKELVSFNEDYAVIDQTNVRKDIGSQTITLNLHIDSLTHNDFPETQEKGKYYTSLSLRTITRHYTDDQDFGSRLLAHGETRLYIDIDEAAARF